MILVKLQRTICDLYVAYTRLYSMKETIAWPVTRCITNGPEVHTTRVNHLSSASSQETLEAATSAT